MKGIYKFRLDCGRMGSLRGVFIASASDVAALIGKTVSFGEVLGKHSDIEENISAKNITLASDDPAAVTLFETLNLETGINPFDYIDESDKADDSEGEDE